MDFSSHHSSVPWGYFTTLRDTCFCANAGFCCLLYVDWKSCLLVSHGPPLVLKTRRTTAFPSDSLSDSWGNVKQRQVLHASVGLMSILLSFSPIYWEIIDLHHYINLRHAVKWFELCLLWSDYNRFSYSSTYIEMKKIILLILRTLRVYSLNNFIHTT